jgi:hemerythrin-like metal-binding protein
VLIPGAAPDRTATGAGRIPTYLRARADRHAGCSTTPAGEEERAMSRNPEYMDTGYVPIDEEHRSISEQLRALVAAVNAADLAQTRALSHVIFKNVASHFAHEERLMAQWKYPKTARHAEAHANFLKDAGQFAAELESAGITPNFRRWVLTRLLPWFKFHIIANDVELGMFLREQARRATADPAAASAPRP